MLLVRSFKFCFNQGFCTKSKVQPICSTGDWQNFASKNPLRKIKTPARNSIVRKKLSAIMTIAIKVLPLTSMFHHKVYIMYIYFCIVSSSTIIDYNYLYIKQKRNERESDNNSTDRSKEDNKEERKRKRRSRWGDPDNKVPVAEMNTLTSHNKQQSSSGFSQPGIAIPGQIGQPAVIIPSPKVQRTETKNPMLTKISRNDPALIQYARQTLGTLDLTEEQRKKAEDHYKVTRLFI